MVLRVLTTSKRCLKRHYFPLVDFKERRIIPLNNRIKYKKNPVTSPQRRWGCEEEIMYEENSLFSFFVRIH